MNLKDDFFKSAPEEWALPLTLPHPTGRLTYWQQQEYVTSMLCGFSFAAHRSFGGIDLWHYKLPTPKGWVYLTCVNPGADHQYVEKNHRDNPFLPKR